MKKLVFGIFALLVLCLIGYKASSFAEPMPMSVSKINIPHYQIIADTSTRGGIWRLDTISSELTYCINSNGYNYCTSSTKPQGGQ